MDELIAGRLFDGRDNAGQSVRLSRSSSGSPWVIQFADGSLVEHPNDAFCPATDTDEYVTALRLHSGELIELDRPVAIPEPMKAAFKQTSAQSASRIDRWIANPRAAWGSAAAMIAVPALLVALIIPWAAGQLVPWVPAAYEQALGRDVLQALKPMFLDSQLDSSREAAITERFAQLAKAAELPQARLLFKRGMFNAFALPGGTVLVTDELIAAMRSDEEVLAVVAHELGHVREQHGLRSLISSSVALQVIATALAHDQLSRKVSEVFVGNAIRAGYSRDAERQADEFAVALMVKAGYPKDSFAQALESLATYQQRYGRGSESSYTSSHPATAERIEAARKP